MYHSACCKNAGIHGDYLRCFITKGRPRIASSQWSFRSGSLASLLTQFSDTPQRSARARNVHPFRDASVLNSTRERRCFACSLSLIGAPPSWAFPGGKWSYRLVRISDHVFYLGCFDFSKESWLWSQWNLSENPLPYHCLACKIGRWGAYKYVSYYIQMGQVIQLYRLSEII